MLTPKPGESFRTFLDRAIPVLTGNGDKDPYATAKRVFDAAKHQQGFKVLMDKADNAPRKERMELTDSPLELKEPVETEEGFVIADARFARTGIYDYVTPEGDVVKMLRTEDEVFSAKSLDSYLLAPLTLDHPDKGFVDSSSYKSLSVGSVGMPGRDGQWVRGPVSINDSDAVKAARDEGFNQLSPGYSSTVIFSSGRVVHDDSTEEEFHAIQTDIMINHVALVKEARAGNNAIVRVDSKDKKEKKMAKKVTINGTELELEDSIADAVLADQASRKAELDKASGELAVLKANDSKKEEANITNAKLKLVTRAAKHLNDDAMNLVELSDRDIMIKCIGDSVDCEGKSDGFVSGVFETVLKTNPSENSGSNTANQIKNAINDSKNNTGSDDNKEDVPPHIAARQKYVQRLNDGKWTK